jgi:hypothetical protein
MRLRYPLAAAGSPIGWVQGSGGRVWSRLSPISRALGLEEVSPHHRWHERVVKGDAVKEAAPRSDSRIERYEWSARWECEGGWGKERVEEGSRTTKRERVVEGVGVAEK